MITPAETFPANSNLYLCLLRLRRLPARHGSIPGADLGGNCRTVKPRGGRILCSRVEQEADAPRFSTFLLPATMRSPLRWPAGAGHQRLNARLPERQLLFQHRNDDGRIAGGAHGPVIEYVCSSMGRESFHRQVGVVCVI